VSAPARILKCSVYGDCIFVFRRHNRALTFENAVEAELWLLVAKGASYGHQNTKSPLFAITVGSAAHLVLDWVLIGTHSENVFFPLFLS
jgi:hypothetical protein